MGWGKANLYREMKESGWVGSRGPAQGQDLRDTLVFGLMRPLPTHSPRSECNVGRFRHTDTAQFCRTCPSELQTLEGPNLAREPRDRPRRRGSYLPRRLPRVERYIHHPLPRHPSLCPRVGTGRNHRNQGTRHHVKRDRYVIADLPS